MQEDSYFYSIEHGNVSEEWPENNDNNNDEEVMNKKNRSKTKHLHLQKNLNKMLLRKWSVKIEAAW